MSDARFDTEAARDPAEIGRTVEVRMLRLLVDAGVEPGIVEMSNAAGLFQLDQLLRDKLEGSGLEEYLEIQVKQGAEEERLLGDFSL